MRDDSRHQAPDDVLFCGIEEQIVHLLGIADAVKQDMVLEFGGIFAPTLSPASTDIGQLVFGCDYAGARNVAGMDEDFFGPIDVFAMDQWCRVSALFAPAR